MEKCAIQQTQMIKKLEWLYLYLKNFKTGKVTKDKDEHFIKIKGKCIKKKKQS